MSRFSISVAAIVLLIPQIATAGLQASRAHVVRPQRGWMAPDAKSKDPWLYVSGDNNSVLIYDLKKLGTPHIGTITAGLDVPGGIAVAPDGTLYVANHNNASTTVYAPGATTPTLTLTGLDAPQAVTLDQSGNVWVLNRGTNPGIAVYAPGATTPMKFITSSLLTVPNQMVFDPSGTLYICDDASGVSYLLPGPSQTVTSLNLQDYGYGPSGLTENPAIGNLYVSNWASPPGRVSMYASGEQYPMVVWEVKRVYGIDFLGFGLWGKHPAVFVPDADSPVVYVLKANLAKKPYATIAVDANAVGVAYKPAGVP